MFISGNIHSGIFVQPNTCSPQLSNSLTYISVLLCFHFILCWYQHHTCGMQAVLPMLNLDLFLSWQHMVGYSPEAPAELSLAACCQPCNHNTNNPCSVLHCQAVTLGGLAII